MLWDTSLTGAVYGASAPRKASVVGQTRLGEQSARRSFTGAWFPPFILLRIFVAFRMTARLFIILTILVLASTGCSPTLSPLYRDYDRPAGAPTAADDENFEGSVARSLRMADWEVIDSDLPNVVVTAPRTFKRWWLYRVEASLEVAPLSHTHARVLVHPYRVYFTGRRSKIPFFRRSLQRAILKDLNAALATEGITALGAVVEQDSKERQLP